MLWRALWPLLVHQLLAAAAVILLMGFPALPEDRVPLSVILTAVMAVPLFGWMYGTDQKRRKEAEPKLWEEAVPLQPYFLVWGVTSCIALALLGNALIAITPLPEWSVGYQEFNESLLTGNPYLWAAASVAAAPLVEELVMRGLCYLRLRDLLGVKWAMLSSALIFGISHGNLVQGVYGFLGGLWFAWLAERFGTILVPVLGHLAANLTVLLLPAGSYGSGALGLEFLLGTVVCAGCMFRTVQVLKK